MWGKIPPGITTFPSYGRHPPPKPKPKNDDTIAPLTGSGAICKGHLLDENGKQNIVRSSDKGWHLDSFLFSIEFHICERFFIIFCQIEIENWGQAHENIIVQKKVKFSAYFWMPKNMSLNFVKKYNQLKTNLTKLRSILKLVNIDKICLKISICVFVHRTRANKGRSRLVAAPLIFQAKNRFL